MSAETIIVEALKASQDVQGLVGNEDSPQTFRIDPMISVQGDELPRITYQRVSNVPGSSLDGNGTLDNTRVQIDCWAADFDGVVALAAAVRAALESIEGYLINDSNPDFDDETATHRASFDYSVWVRLGG